jgi:hypothetical protein
VTEEVGRGVILAKREEKNEGGRLLPRLALAVTRYFYSLQKADDSNFVRVCLCNLRVSRGTRAAYRCGQFSNLTVNL